MDELNKKEGTEFLEAHGINLFHAFDTLDLVDLFSEAVPDLEVDKYPTTILLANAGFEFWHSLKQADIRGDHPVDQYSILLAKEYAQEYLNCEAQFLYPSDYPISLREVGFRTGWSFTTPMGITIHPKYGTWYAYRALFLVETELPASQPLIADHPCESCVDKPCQTVCPSGAVQQIGSFGLEQCARYRIEDDSPCSFQCLSRNRCPVGTEYQYVPEQMKYHYNRSRNTMIRYFKSDSNN